MKTETVRLTNCYAGPSYLTSPRRRVSTTTRRVELVIEATESAITSVTNKLTSETKLCRHPI